MNLIGHKNSAVMDSVFSESIIHPKAEILDKMAAALAHIVRNGVQII